ncbi:MAG: T9SS type A sorting domain-containing protein [Bacteroidota bacterium]
MRFRTLILLFLSTGLLAQSSFTAYYGYPDDHSQETGLLVVPNGEELLVVGMAEEIPEGGPGLTFLRTRKSNGTILSREYLPAEIFFYDARAHGSDRGDFLVSSRVGSNQMYLAYFNRQGSPVWNTEVDLGSPNANHSLLVGIRNAAFQFYTPFVEGQQRNLLRNFTPTGEIGWTIDLTPTDTDQFQQRVVVDGDGHPVVLTASPAGFRLRSYDRLNGSLRWERDFSDIDGLQYPLQVDLTVDEARDQLLVTGAHSNVFEQEVRIGLVVFGYGGENVGRYSLGSLDTPASGDFKVAPNGDLLLRGSCQWYRWSDYERSPRMETLSFCDGMEDVDRLSVTYQDQENIYLTGALRTTNRFDHNLYVAATSTSDLRWAFDEGRAGRQDEEYPVAAGAAPDGSGYYFLASVPQDDNSYVPQLTKVNTTGTVLWQRSLPLADLAYSYGRGLRVLRNGNVLVSLAGRKRTGDFILSPTGEQLEGQDGATDFNHHTRSRSYPLELSDGTLITHEGRNRRGQLDEIVLFEYAAEGFAALRAVHEIAGFPSGELTGLTDLGDGTLLLLGRPDRELSTVTAIRYDLRAKRILWRWSAGSFGTGAREIKDALVLDNGDLVLLLWDVEINPATEIAAGSIRLVRLADNGTELASRSFIMPSEGVLTTRNLDLAENGDLLLTTRDDDEFGQVLIRRFAQDDLMLLSERQHRINDPSWLDLVYSQYLGNNRYLFFGSTFAPERRGQQLFLSVIGEKDLTVRAMQTSGFGSPVEVFPNPTTDILTVKLTFPIARTLHGRLYDAGGQLITDWSRSAETEHQQRVDLSNVPKGSYLLRLDNGEREETKWLIKQ